MNTITITRQQAYELLSHFNTEDIVETTLKAELTTSNDTYEIKLTPIIEEIVKQTRTKALAEGRLYKTYEILGRLKALMVNSDE